MNFIQLSKRQFFYSCVLLCCSHGGSADTIYQWTDPWGQVKYSKTQVQGSMVSELTEFPISQRLTEQQKQEAMLKKMQAINNTNTRYQQKKITEKLLKQQKKINEKHCQMLRNTLADIKLRNLRRYYPRNSYLPGQNFDSARNYYHGGYGHYRNSNYDFLENDLYKQIREYCR